jgi:sodium/proline symporter
MTSDKILMIATIFVYLAGMLWIGWMYARRTKNVGDFYLGGRTLDPLTTAMSAEASDMSSWLLLGVPGLAYISGVADAAWTCIGLAVGTYLNWLIVARRIRAYTAHTNSITIPDFFSRRFGDERNTLSCIAALVIVVFFVPYTASGFAACGKLFSSLFGWNYAVSMLISAAVIVAYTTLGGFNAASTTDLIQSIVMTFALILVFAFGISAAGGMDAVMENARAMPGYLSFTQTHDVATGTAAPYGFLNIVSMLAWGLGYFGMPHILLRFMAIEDPEKLKLSRRVASIWVVISMTAALFIGIVGNAVSSVGLVERFTNTAQAETITIRFAALIAQYSWLAAIGGGLILAGILAATMSTADSQLLAAASSVSQNLADEFLHIKMSPKRSMQVARLSVISISVVGSIIALNPNSSVFNIVSFAWAGFGAAFGPVMLLGLFWRRANKQGALAGMVSGGAMVFIWKFALRPLGGAWNIYELLPAFIVACAANVIVSLLTAAPDKAVTDTFDAVQKELGG